MITKTCNDATAERDQLIKTIVPDIMKILSDYNIRQGDLEAIINAVNNTYNYSYVVALSKAFGTYNATKHPDQLIDNIRISDIARVAGQ